MNFSTHAAIVSIFPKPATAGTEKVGFTEILEVVEFIESVNLTSIKVMNLFEAFQRTRKESEKKRQRKLQKKTRQKEYIEGGELVIRRVFRGIGDTFSRKKSVEGDDELSLSQKIRFLEEETARELAQLKRERRGKSRLIEETGRELDKRRKQYEAELEEIKNRRAKNLKC